MLTVLCVLFRGTTAQVPSYSAGVYGPEWVDRLYRGVRRHLSEPFRFVCLADEDYEFEEQAIELVRLERPGEGWMAINEAFRPDLGVERGLLTGLDTVIWGSLDELAAWRGSIAVPLDPYGTHRICNAMVLFDGQAADHLWRTWDANRARWRADCIYHGKPSEMLFLRKMRRDTWTILDREFPGQLVSYKAHCRQGVPEDARVVYFHGHPRPGELPPRHPVRVAWEAA